MKVVIWARVSSREQREGYSIDAQLRVDEVNEELRLALPEGEDYETVAGLILHLLRRIPSEGERLRVGNVQLTVAETRGPKIEKVIIRW